MLPGTLSADGDSLEWHVWYRAAVVASASRGTHYLCSDDRLRLPFDLY